MNLKSKKGFTLIELLAVIVILALLVLVATPIVQRVIANSQRNTFVDEVTSLAGYLDTAYSDTLMNGKTNVTEPGGTSPTDFCISTEGTGNSSKVTVCATMQGLVRKGYVKKADADKWGGYVKTTMIGDQGTITKYFISNSEYKVNTQEKLESNIVEAEASNTASISDPCDCTALSATPATPAAS